MAIYEQLCGCVVEITPELRGVRASSTRVIGPCDKHREQPLSFGRLASMEAQAAAAVRETAREFPRGTVADTLRHMAPAAPIDVSEFGVPKQGKSLLSRLADTLFSGIEVHTPDVMEHAHSHTLCDEQVDFLNLTLQRERVELLQERRQWVNLRKQDRTAGLNRITEIDAEIEMIDSITLKLRRIP